MLTASFMKSISSALKQSCTMHNACKKKHPYTHSKNYMYSRANRFPCSLALPEYSLIAHSNKMQLLFIFYFDGFLFDRTHILHSIYEARNIFSTWSSNISICENVFSTHTKNANGIHLLTHCGMHLHRICIWLQKSSASIFNTYSMYNDHT